MIPVPDNPQHVDNLKSLALLKEQGFQGVDKSLAISLGEYNLAWRELPTGEFLFIYRILGRSDARYDRAVIKPTDPKVEWDWVDWGELLSYLGDEEEDWMKLPFPRQVADIHNYYGFENTFGSSYWEGFAIEGIED